jgi:transmembrane sensor
VTDHDSKEPRRSWRTDAEWEALKSRIDAAEAFLVPAGNSTPRRVADWWRRGAAPLRVAAVIVIAVALAFGVRARVATPEARTVVTGRAERMVVRLGDSSVVTLGPSSTLRYSVTGSGRTFELEGLADFLIAHDPRRPAIVRAAHAQAIDIGTRFVVRAYRGESEVRVAVSSGVVALSTLGANARRVELNAGDVGSLRATDSVAVTRRGDVPSYMAWMEGRLAFDDQSLAEVAAELSRWFDVEIRIAHPSLERRRITAVYNNPSLSAVLDALALTVGARYERVGRTVTLMPGRPRAST